MVATAVGADDKVSKSGDTMTGPLVLEGAPPLVIPAGAATGTAPVSDGSGNLTQQGIFGTRPEWFGTVTGVSGDQVAINAAISAVRNNKPGCPGPVVISQPSAIDSTITAAAGVNMAFTGQGNRQNGVPDTFLGGYILPSALFPSSTPLITVGTVSAPTTNPNGLRLEGLCLSGLNTSGTLVSGCIGLQVNDTADVHLTNAFLANFDRTGATGTCIQLASSSSGNGVGFNLHHSVLSASWQGLAGDGAGVTDLRLSNNLWHSNTEQITLGTTAGGGGLQMVNEHATYAGMPSGGWHLNLGAQSGSYAISNCYFDQAGSATMVKLANSKGSLTGNIFLPAGSSTATALVRLTTTGQELTFCNNSANGNGSGINGMLWLSAISSAPAGGILCNNSVFGTAASLVGVIIYNSSPTALANLTTLPSSASGAIYLGNMTFS